MKAEWHLCCDAPGCTRLLSAVGYHDRDAKLADAAAVATLRWLAVRAGWILLPVDGDGTALCPSHARVAN